MMDLVLQCVPAFMLGIIGGLWIVARDRRTAVDRLVERIERVGKLDSHSLEPLGPIQGLKYRIRCAGTTPDGQDAPGRVIARSVKRVTKDTR